jgi:hypothetical protein
MSTPYEPWKPSSSEFYGGNYPHSSTVDSTVFRRQLYYALERAYSTHHHAESIVAIARGTVAIIVLVVTITYLLRVAAESRAAAIVTFFFWLYATTEFVLWWRRRLALRSYQDAVKRNEGSGGLA